MTSTAVKGVGSLFADMTAAQAGKNASGAPDFQNVWNDQLNKNAANTSSDGAEQTAKKQNVPNEQIQKGSSLKVKESQTVQEEPRETQMLSVEEQEQAMEVLGSAALKLMQEIADVFGITVEELQAVMDELGMGQLDVLDASKLSALLLNLGGAEDLYALITDGDLYENYRMLMDQRSGILQESADVLDTEPEKLLTLLQENVVNNVPAEEGLVETERPKEQPELLRQDERPADTPSGTDVNAVQETAQKGQETQSQTDTGRHQERHSEGKSEREPQMNPFVQNFRAENFQPEAAQVQSMTQSSPWSENTQNIMNQILDYMKLQLNADSTNLEMQLHPASLGTLQIQLASKAGVVTANFIAQNEAVKAALETQMIQLKEQFEEQGIRVESIEVTVQTHEFERNLDEQGRGRNRQPEKKNRSRKINLAGAVSGDETDSDEPAAERMAASGSTVEYTA
ncbi:MAG: hypothetical protein HFH93_10615 [Lachnospiraceae bacterium]|nr:hypothetical protein [Lachnospiraceae bacterium]